MAFALLMRLPGLRLDQYDRLIAECGLDVVPPVGQILHAVAETPGHLETWDIWQTRETAVAFLETRFKPTLRWLRIDAEPEVRIVPLHNLFAPDIETIERIGAVSTPAGAGRSP